MFKRIPTVRQHDLKDCGAACLQSVASHYGLRLSIARIRQYASTDQKGTNVLGLLEAASKLGFIAKGVRSPFEALGKVPSPSIAHVSLPNGQHHFVVIYRLTKSHVVVMNPGDGLVHAYTHEAFRAMWTGVLVLLVPGGEFRGGNQHQSTLSRFSQLVRPHRGILTQALLGAAVQTILGVSTSIYVQQIVDHVIGDGNRNLLNLMSLLMIAALTVQLLVGFLKNVFTLQSGQGIDGALILGYYKHLLTLPQQFFDTMRVGEITSRISDAVKIRSFINEVALDLVVNALIVLFSLSLMFLYSAKLAFLTLALVPVYGTIYWFTNRVNRRRQRRLMEKAADLQAQLVESLNAVSTIKRFGLEWFANIKTETRFVGVLREVYRTSMTGMISGTSTEAVSRLLSIVLLWVGAGLVLDQTLTPGQLISCYALVGFLTWPVAKLIGMNRTIQDALIAADRLFEIMDLEQEQSGSRITLTREMIGAIRFQNVSFRYGSRARVFDGLDLEIPRSKLTAVVGESGSGKSTLMALLQNLYPVEVGQVFLGDYDIQHISNESLRSLVSAVPQRIDLFSGSVLENIAIGDPAPDLKRVVSICRMLGIAEFVERLPANYHTSVGENGAALSGGQRQRLAIARALYRAPEILILDEATSSLDSGSEQYVQQTLQQLRDEGKTILVIAHRLSTIRAADMIVVLEAGRVVQRGTHQELLDRDGSYRRLWQHQFP